jgi:two-component system, NarL family, response regulator LiaR
MSGDPIRVAVANDFELVVVGIAGILQRFPERIEVVELDSGVPVEAEVDVILYDSFGQPQGAALDVPSVVGQTRAKVVIFSWNTQPELVEQSLAAGASGYISKAVTGEELVSLIEKVCVGETVVPDELGDFDGAVGRWPGDEHGLSPREAEVLALICQGLTNDQITDKAFLSINTVKTYVRTLYRKIGVESRTQAVLWGIDHGFRPDRVRHRLDTER